MTTRAAGQEPPTWRFAGEPPRDPLDPGPDGVWDDGHVTVGRNPALPAEEHFRVTATHERILLEHNLLPDQLDNDLAGILAAEVFGPYGLTDPTDLGRLVVGCVRSTVPGAHEAWSTFYTNSLARLARPRDGQDQLAVFSRIYDRARNLVRGRSVLDLGSCLGLLPIQLTATGYQVTASDSDAGVVRFLTAMTQHRGDRLTVLQADAARLPLPAAGVDTVLGLHLLEHLDVGHGAAVVAEALRVARLRVVFAVPYEPIATAAYGHVRTFTAADLHELGARTGCPYEVHDSDGGWLVLDPRPLR